MKQGMRVLTEKPRNAETPPEYLRSWVTANAVFFERNQGGIPSEPVSLADWRLSITGQLASPQSLSFDQISRMPKAIAANTSECSGNGRSLLREKASGNPWTIGGVGNAVYGGVWLKDVLAPTGLKHTAKHVAFEGMDTPLGSKQVKFIRSIPLEKAMASTLLAYEMNGEPLPLKHGYPLRALALGWSGANCVKWLHKIMVLDRPFEGFFMDKVYRVFQTGQDPKTGEVCQGLKLKSIITQPLPGEAVPAGVVAIRGAAYAGEGDVESLEISVDAGRTWHPAEFIGPHEPYAWRQWQYVWHVSQKGEFTIMARATDTRGRRQPMNAAWNVLGYFNNGVREHAVAVRIT